MWKYLARNGKANVLVNVFKGTGAAATQRINKSDLFPGPLHWFHWHRLWNCHISVCKTSVANGKYIYIYIYIYIYLDGNIDFSNRQRLKVSKRNNIYVKVMVSNALVVFWLLLVYKSNALVETVLSSCIHLALSSLCFSFVSFVCFQKVSLTQDTTYVTARSATQPEGTSFTTLEENLARTMGFQ